MLENWQKLDQGSIRPSLVLGPLAYRKTADGVQSWTERRAEHALDTQWRGACRTAFTWVYWTLGSEAVPFQVSLGMEIELPRCSQAWPSAVLGQYLVHQAGFVSRPVHQDLPGHSQLCTLPHSQLKPFSWFRSRCS